MSISLGRNCRNCGNDNWTVSGHHPNCACCARARTKKWCSENIQRHLSNVNSWRSKNIEKVAQIKRDWQKRNLPAGVAKAARYLARKLSAPGRGVTVAQWGLVLVESLGLCVYCNERRVLTMDHIYPLNRGGEHDIANIAAACQPCNASKGDKTLLIWLIGAANDR